MEGPLSAVVAPFWELEDDGTVGRSEESGAAGTKEDQISQHSTLRLPSMNMCLVWSTSVYTCLKILTRR